MKVLVVGGGSMGRRRLRDLLYLCPGEVTLLEPDSKRCQEVAAQFGVEGFTQLSDALRQKPAAMVVSTPPALHESYVQEAIRNGIHVFCELPFVFNRLSLVEIVAQVRQKKIVLGISATIRFYPPYAAIRKLLRESRIGDPFYLEYSLGNHIADWHPYEDYRKFYAADAALGGAGMDMLLHELAPIQWWLGDIASVAARLSKISPLQIKGPDSHDVLLTFKSGCRGFFHHDILEQGTIGRHIRIVGERGTIEWHQNQPAIRLFLTEQGNREIAFDQAPDWDEAISASREMAQILARQSAESEKIPSASGANYSYESNYLREMRHFVEAAGGKHPYAIATIQEEMQTLQVFDAIMRSSKSMKETLVENERVG